MSIRTDLALESINAAKISEDVYKRQLNFSALQSGIVNRIQAYISPKILGGKSAPSPVGGMGFDSPDSGIILCSPEITYFGNDILIEDVYKRQTS